MMHLSPLRLGILFLIPIILFAYYQTSTRRPSYPLIRGTSIETFQQYLTNGSYTSEELVRTFLARIAEVNNVTHAVAELNPDALTVARALDRERKCLVLEGTLFRILHGIPILVKDSISAHGMNNTAGSHCLVGARTKDEASLITRLRNAGAIILGKANMSQWGNARSSGDNASNGWSSWGGQTYGVYVTEQDPCGSSSGSATAMAMGLAAVTVGVETVGSITCPAMKSNIVSIKATAGLVPKDNIIVTKRRGSVGPMASTVRDAAILLTFMAGKSDSDPRTNQIPFETVPNYAAFCDPSALRGSRIGIPRNGLKNPIGVGINTTAIMNAFEEAISLMMANGATIIDNANYPAYDEVYSIEPQGIVGPAEYKADLADYFDNLSVNPNMITCTKSHAKEEFPSRNIDFWEKVKDAPDFNSPEITAAFEHMRFLGAEGGIDGALDMAKADALILPSVICSDIPGLVGYPTINVPMGYLPDGTPNTKNPRGDLVDEAPNVPFGLCFIGRAFSEEKLIGLAYAFEQLTHVAVQRVPVVLPKTELIDVVSRRRRS